MQQKTHTKSIQIKFGVLVCQLFHKLWIYLLLHLQKKHKFVPVLKVATILHQTLRFHRSNQIEHEVDR